MVEHAEVSPQVTGRLRWVRLMLLTALLGLTAYLFDMQVLRKAEYRALAEQNSMKRVTIRAPRGLLLDRDGRVLVKNRPSFQATVVVERMVDSEATLARARTALNLDPAAAQRLRKRLRRKDRSEVLVKEDINLAEVAVFEARSYEWPEFRVREGLVRSYPYGSAAAHALGHMGEIREDQLLEPEFRSYESGEVIGQSGIESRYETSLRGRDGFRRVLVNSRGREIRDLQQIESPLPGLDLHLTLDLDVQQAAEAAFGDDRGAAVAIDSRTGEVLALLSRPAYDPNAFAGKVTGEDWQRYHQDAAHPMFDRALLGRLPPGSVFKIVDAIAGLEERSWDPAQTVSCNGQTVVHGDVFHCWKKGGHGVVSFHEALRGSCNVYFYHRGDAIGIDNLSKWAHRLGLGDRTGIDIDPEGRGVVPDPAWKRRVKGEPWWPGETVSVAIGQGALAVSVLQVSSMMQVVANGGRAYVPQVVSAVGADGFHRAPELARELSLRPDTLALVRKGLWAVVNETGGTGAKARIAGFDVTGKTGTAQPPPSGPEAGKEHAWFAGYAPGNDPVAVVAVFVEHGGHGGESAAPIAGAILARILEKRGLKAAVPPAAPAEPETLPEAAPGPALVSVMPVFLGPPRPPGTRTANSLLAPRVMTSPSTASLVTVVPVFLGPPRPPAVKIGVARTGTTKHPGPVTARAAKATGAVGGFAAAVRIAPPPVAAAPTSLEAAARPSSASVQRAAAGHGRKGRVASSRVRAAKKRAAARAARTRTHTKTSSGNGQ